MKNELQKFPEQTTQARKDSPRRKTTFVKHYKNGLQTTQRKYASFSLALVGSVYDGKAKLTTLGQGKPAQPWHAESKTEMARKEREQPAKLYTQKLKKPRGKVQNLGRRSIYNHEQNYPLCGFTLPTLG